MKLKKFGLAMLPLAATGAALPVVVSCNQGKSDDIKTIYYDEAKKWVKDNFGAIHKTYESKKSESTWMFGGWVTTFGGASSQAGTRMEWLLGHLENMLKKMTSSTDTTEILKTELDRQGSIGTVHEDRKCYLGEFAFYTDKLENKKITIETGLDNSDTIAEDNFDTIISSYFSTFFKNNADFIVNNTKKTLTVHGTLSSVGARDGGTDNLKIPGAYVTFNSLGLITNVKIDIKDLTLCSYHWMGTSASSDGYSFVLLPSSYMNFNFAYGNQIQ